MRLVEFSLGRIKSFQFPGVDEMRFGRNEAVVRMVKVQHHY